VLLFRELFKALAPSPSPAPAPEPAAADTLASPKKEGKKKKQKAADAPADEESAPANSPSDAADDSADDGNSSVRFDGVKYEVVLLENVELILEAFDYLQLPFTLKQGFAGDMVPKNPASFCRNDPA
ncbi:hypothetical protein HN51_050598, partial [Arachis hypogaea]